MNSTVSGALIVRPSLKILGFGRIDIPHQNISVFVRLSSAGSGCLQGLEYLPSLEY